MNPDVAICGFSYINGITPVKEDEVRITFRDGSVFAITTADAGLEIRLVETRGGQTQMSIEPRVSNSIVIKAIK